VLGIVPPAAIEYPLPVDALERSKLIAELVPMIRDE
jgi:hypothetical protein